MQQVIWRERRPLTKFARQALAEPGQPPFVLTARLAVMQKRIAKFVGLSMDAERYRETHTDPQIHVEFVRRYELFEHHAAEVSGDENRVIDRAIDHVGEHLATILASCSARRPLGICPPLQTQHGSWASRFDTGI